MTEQQLRKALDAANDLEPPRDDLFAQRALERGRARTARRRHVIVGAAAGVALVSVVGGTWLGSQLGGTNSASRAASAESGPESFDATGGAGGLLLPPSNKAAGGGEGWISGRVTPQRGALEDLLPSLQLTYPDTFGGAYATDPTNTRFVVTETRRDPGLEAFVTERMPSPGDVTFTVVSHTAALKQQVAARVLDDTADWLTKGVTIVGVRIDARADRVVVTVREPSAPTAVEAHYGRDLVRAAVGSGPPIGGVVTEPAPPPSGR